MPGALITKGFSHFKLPPGDGWLVGQLVRDAFVLLLLFSLLEATYGRVSGLFMSGIQLGT